MTLLTTTTPLDDSAVREHLDACLGQLPELQRAVIASHYLGGIPRDALALRLGVSIDAIHQHCSRGLARLREMLQRRGVVVGATLLTTVCLSEASAATAANPPPDIDLYARAAIESQAAQGVGASFWWSGGGICAASLLSVWLAYNLNLAGAAEGPNAIQPTTVPTEVPPERKTVTVHWESAGLDEIEDVLLGEFGDFLRWDPAVRTSEARITLYSHDMTRDSLVRWIGRLGGWHVAATASREVVMRARPPEEVGAPGLGWLKLLENGLGAPHRKVSLEFNRTPVLDLASYLNGVLHLNVAIDRQLAERNPLVNLAVRDMDLGDALYWLGQMNGFTCGFSDGAVFLSAALPEAESPNSDDVPRDTAFDKRLSVAITADIPMAPVTDFLSRLQFVSGVNIMLDRRITPSGEMLSLDGTGETLEQVLRAVTSRLSAKVIIRNGAAFITVAGPSNGHAPAIPTTPEIRQPLPPSGNG